MDPLAELKDIHLPQDISWWPLAWGWWLLFALILTLTIVIGVRIYKYRQLTAVKRQALNQLQDLDKPEIHQLVTILKSVAMSYFPRQQFASLHSQQLFTELTQQLPVKKQQQFNQLTSGIEQALYQQTCAENINTQLKQACHFWITNALPPKRQVTSGGDHA